MSTIKVNTIDNEGGAVDFPNKLTVRGNAIERTYTSSGTEPNSPSEGDLWYDSGNSLLKHYINSEFKTISINVPTINFGGDRGVFGGGNTDVNNIDYLDITSAGNAVDFGDLTTGMNQNAAGSNSTRGLIAGGSNGGDTINYVTIASTGNASDFGDLSAGNNSSGAATTATRWVTALMGGSNTLEYVTIASTSNTTDFGDLTWSSTYGGASSTAHGGL